MCPDLWYNNKENRRYGNMKKQNVLNLIKYHVERNENSFRNEAIAIARYFDSIGDYQLSEYIMGLISESNLYSPQSSDFESEFLKQVEIRNLEALNLPLEITEDIKGIINAVNHNVGINKFLFEGLPGSGKTEAAKNVARLLDRSLFRVDFENLIDSKLGQTNKNIIKVFREINIISAIGIIFGIPLGFWLHKFVIKKIENGGVMFVRNFSNTTYVYAILITVSFVILTNLVMARKINKIDMVSAMKAND